VVHKECFNVLRDNRIKITVCKQCKANLITPTYYDNLCEKCSEKFTLCLICGKIIEDLSREKIRRK
jgi:uncharacterized protein with PIN domain